MFSRRGISLTFASVAVAGVIAVPAFALASGGGGSSTLTAPAVVQQVEGDTDAPEGEHEGRCGFRGQRGERGSALAEALGVELEVLRTAAEAARESLGDRPDEITPEVIEARHAAFVSALATELGISEAEITAAMETLRADRLSSIADRVADAVAEGKITQERADEILQSLEDGERPFKGLRGRFHGRHGGGHGGDSSTTPTGQSA